MCLFLFRNAQLPHVSSLPHAGASRRFAALLTLCFSLLWLTGCDGDKTAAESGASPAAIPVKTLRLQGQEVPEDFSFVGLTKSSQQVNIVSRVNGFLDKQVYQDGAMVKQGQTLFLVDAKPFQAQLQAAQAALSQQKANLLVAQQNLRRIKPLAAQNAASQKDLDQAIGQEKSAQAQVEMAKAQVVQAQLNLGYATIKSPLAGISGEALIDEGTYVTASDKLTYVAALSPMWVNFSISEAQSLKRDEMMRQGLLRYPGDSKFDVQLTLSDNSVYPENGRITFANAEYDSKTGTFLVRASFENADGKLRPGQFVRVTVKGAVRPNAILVPQSAVMQGANGHFVWVVNKDNKAEYRAVTVGSYVGHDWLIEQGLQPGEQVVVEGGMMLRPDTPVVATEVSATALKAADAASAGTSKPESVPAPKPDQKPAQAQ
ncbi:efflux RND transporter periplasmic adaptor subunit [Plesiomonas shigelloides]|uniref:efflux RND transporter periplasmic adaptor subunit n=1 Tax=Plesiomonas shigelloides TaxID=703 RepID=UPI0007F0EBE9|nr:efflux RND transporter periplasmic adaptor subunit [Plesiomonas shigelloides]KAB7688597.1 efflux RND transporter periplasmic adaptor subunit [Plesiomonas shigelloides]SBT61738.1 Efflux pump periplasmic linker BepF [Plesiomonas shigelloides]